MNFRFWLVSCILHGEELRPKRVNKQFGERAMLSWAIIFLVFAIIAGLTGIAGIASGVAQSLFLIFLVLFLAAMVARTFHDDPPDTGMS
jgi:uncharacterized membrane protein YtjA (UPF0391 family)